LVLAWPSSRAASIAAKWAPSTTTFQVPWKGIVFADTDASQAGPEVGRLADGAGRYEGEVRGELLVDGVDVLE